MSYDVTVKFRTKDAAHQFMSWMSEQGEQDMDVWWDVSKADGYKVGDTCFDYDYDNNIITQRKPLKD